MKVSSLIESAITISKRPCINCKISFNIEDKFSKYCPSCSENIKKENQINKKLNHQLSLKICDNCRKKFMVGNSFSKLCQQCNTSQVTIQKSKNSYNTGKNTINEYIHKASTGVRWGREFVYSNNNEPTPILLIEGKFYLINKDGNKKCVGNRVPSRPYVIQKYENLLTPEQLKALKTLISF